MQSNLLVFAKAIAYLALAYFTYLMILITLQYIPLKFDVAFLNIKQDEIAYRYYQVAFFAHVYTSIFVLIAGIPQFSSLVRTSWPQIHRKSGKVYIFLVLFVASPSGLIMAVHANGGLSSKISFILQALLWFVFTFLAFNFIRKKDWQKHRNFMLRSYALTLSAISLRLFKWGIVSFFELGPLDTYKIVSWLGWVFNLALVEIYISKKNQL